MTKDEKNHYDKLAQLGCVVCKREGWGFSMAEIHHMRSKAGAGRKNHWSLSIPLCPNHHRTGGFGIAIHAGQKTFEAKFGTEAELLAYSLDLLNKSG